MANSKAGTPPHADDDGSSELDERSRTEVNDMNESTPPPAEYGAADRILFQAWLVLFLLVLCFALVNYLASYVP